MGKQGEWASKVLTLIKRGNAGAAIAQIKVAPTVRDLLQLHAAIARQDLAGRWPDVDQAIQDNTVALSAPRLHRSP